MEFPANHTEKFQKYKRAKWLSNFVICGAKNVVENYGASFVRA